MCDRCGWFFMSQFNEGADTGKEWNVIKVSYDGNPVVLETCGDEDVAELMADELHEECLAEKVDNAQFGVGA